MDQIEKTRKRWEKPGYLDVITARDWIITSLITLGVLLVLFVTTRNDNIFDLVLSYVMWTSGLVTFLLGAIVIFIHLKSYKKSRIELSAEVNDGVIRISWRRYGQEAMRILCYKYANELPLGPYGEEIPGNSAKLIENSTKWSDTVEDGSVQAGNSGFYGFELQNEGKLFISKQSPFTWDFKVLAVRVPLKPKEKSPEEKTREQINGIISSTMEMYQKLDALDKQEAQLLRDVDGSDRPSTEKERVKEVVRRLMRDARARLMNVSEGKR